MQVVHVSPELEGRALTWLQKHDERPYSFVDATSFAVMRSLKMREALAFDGDRGGWVHGAPSDRRVRPLRGVVDSSAFVQDSWGDHADPCRPRR